MKTIAFLCGVLACGPISAIEIDGKVITLDDEEYAVCQEEGGCFVITKQGLQEQIERHSKRALIACRNSV